MLWSIVGFVAQFAGLGLAFFAGVLWTLVMGLVLRHKFTNTPRTLPAQKREELEGWLHEQRFTEAETRALVLFRQTQRIYP